MCGRIISSGPLYQRRDVLLTERPSAGHQHISNANYNRQWSHMVIPVESSWHHVVVNQLPLPPKVDWTVQLQDNFRPSDYGEEDVVNGQRHKDTPEHRFITLRSNATLLSWLYASIQFSCAGWKSRLRIWKLMGCFSKVAPSSELISTALSTSGSLRIII